MPFFYFNFLNWNFSLSIMSVFLKSLGCVDSILIKGTLSQNFDIRLSFHFIYKKKKQETFSKFLQIIS